MHYFYPSRVEDAGALDTWKTAPVAFETCGTIQNWVDKGFEVKYIFDYALAFHTSILNNKSSSIPPETWPLVNDFLRRMGYRLVLRELRHPKEITPAGMFVLTARWANVGVAPLYREGQVAWRLRSASGDTVPLGTSKVSVRSWLPGEYAVRDEFSLAVRPAPGLWELDVAILARETGKPDVRLAIDGRRDDGWYKVSTVGGALARTSALLNAWGRRRRGTIRAAWEDRSPL
jgi:hypothetical protein